MVPTAGAGDDKDGSASGLGNGGSSGRASLPTGPSAPFPPAPSPSSSGDTPRTDPSPAERSILIVLDGARSTVDELAATAGLPDTAVGPALARLAARGWVEELEGDAWTFWQITWRGRYALRPSLLTGSALVAAGGAAILTSLIGLLLAIQSGASGGFAAFVPLALGAGGVAVAGVGLWIRERDPPAVLETATGRSVDAPRDDPRA